MQHLVLTVVLIFHEKQKNGDDPAEVSINLRMNLDILVHFFLEDTHKRYNLNKKKES